MPGDDAAAAAKPAAAAPNAAAPAGSSVAAAATAAAAAPESPRAAAAEARAERRSRRQLRMLVPMLLAALLQYSPSARERASDALEALLVGAGVKTPELPSGPPAEVAHAAHACALCNASSSSSSSAPLRPEELLACAAGAARHARGATRVAIVQHIPAADVPWAAPAAANNALYAATHGYAYRLALAPPSSAKRHPSWAKVALLRQYIDASDEFDALLWLEPYVVLTKHARSLDFMLSSRLGDAHKDVVTFEADARGGGGGAAAAAAVADTSALLVRRTPWARAFLTKWWRASSRLRAAEAFAGGHRLDVTDTLALDALWRADADGVQARGVLLRRSALAAGAPVWAHEPGFALLLGGGDESAAAAGVLSRVTRAALRAACGAAPRLDKAALRRAVARAHEVTVARGGDADADAVAAAHHALGRMAAANGEWGAAVPALRAAAAAWPRRGDVHSALGAALSALRQHDDAVAAFRVAVEVERTNADAHARLAAALLAAQQPRAAAVAASASLALQPGHAAGTAVRCWALRQVGDAAHAAEADALCAQAAAHKKAHPHSSFGGM
jgi:hypothetical protein